MDPVVINDVQVCLYLNSQYSLVLSLCSSKHTFCETRSTAFKSLWLFVIMVYTFLDVQSNIACRSWFFSSSSSSPPPFISSTVLLNCSNLFCRTSSSGLDFGIKCSISSTPSLQILQNQAFSLWLSLSWWYWIIYVSLTSFTLTSAFCISDFRLFYTIPYIMWCSYRFLLNFKVSDSCFRWLFVPVFIYGLHHRVQFCHQLIRCVLTNYFRYTIKLIMADVGKTVISCIMIHRNHKHMKIYKL